MKSHPWRPRESEVHRASIDGSRDYTVHTLWIFFSCKGLMACQEPREFVSIRNDLGRVSGPLPGVGEGKSGFILCSL